MPKDLKLRIKIKALPEDVYAALTNPFAIELWTGYPAVMDTTPGSPFELFEGDIAGHNIAFVENSRIDQEWYFGDNDVPSIVTLKIFPNGASATQLDVIHTNIPDDAFDDIKEGWEEHYLSGLKEFLEISED
ncbi:MAG: SRPBCC domain-containing protein [Breznakibacter sp.]